MFWPGERADTRPPLGDPVSLNIGINCQWQQACMKTQSKAMKRALNYVRKTQPPPWRVQLCNRNAGRQRVRVHQRRAGTASGDCRVACYPTLTIRVRCAHHQPPA